MVKRPMENPTTAMRDAPMSGLANLMAMKGREGDSMLVHLNPREVDSLNKLSGNTMTINPDTGLPEGKSRFMDALLPALASIAVGVATGGATLPAQMAAQAATGYGASRLMGKEHDEALTSGLISGATAGLFGGTGSDALAGGAAKGKLASTAVGLDALKGKAVEGITKENIFRGGVKAVQDATTKEANELLLKQVAEGQIKRDAAKLAGNYWSPWLGSSGDTFGEIAAKRATEGLSYGEILKQPEIYKPLITHTAARTGLNALTDQMRADANRPRDLSGPPRATGELWSQPYNMNLQGPYSESDVTGAFIGDNITPINYYNQGYAKEGGLVQHMAQGGLTGLPVHMGIGGDIAKFISPLYGLFSLLKGRKKSDTVQPTGQPTGQPIQLGNPFVGDPISPPLPANIFEQANVQMAFGGKLGKALGIGGGSGSVSAGPRGSSQGGKGKLFNSPEILELLMKSQQDTGGSTGLDQFADITDNPTQQMAGGGMPDMSNIPPEILEQLKAQASAPAPKAYDQLAALGQNPMQQMQGGGLTGAAEASGSMMPALQPLLQVASEEALQAVAQPRTYAQGGQPFEGRVAGQGDGMSDQVPFNIEGQQPALLSRDEYVVPADVVAMVGDGSSNAGADQFDNFIGDIRTMKYGRQVQPRELNQGLGSLLGVA